MRTVISAEEYRAQAREFQEAAKKLLELADFIEPQTSATRNGKTEKSATAPVPNNKELALISLLQAEGPVARKTIMERIGIASGSVSYYLRKIGAVADKSGDGWYITKSKEEPK